MVLQSQQQGLKAQSARRASASKVSMHLVSFSMWGKKEKILPGLFPCEVVFHPFLNLCMRWLQYSNCRNFCRNKKLFSLPPLLALTYHKFPEDLCRESHNSFKAPWPVWNSQHEEDWGKHNSGFICHYILTDFPMGLFHAFPTQDATSILPDLG